jgi:nitrate/TMAO reductase-like tetraheme cytochrome c subunit
VTSCVFCHHTDQPKANLKAPLITSERDVVLSADVLKDAAATPVKTCRSCHLQSGDESKPLPVVTKDGKQVKMDNENAYHINCFECHDAAIKAKPELAQKISGSDPKGCGKCHAAK